MPELKLSDDDVLKECDERLFGTLRLDQGEVIKEHLRAAGFDSLRKITFERADGVVTYKQEDLDYEDSLYDERRSWWEM